MKASDIPDHEPLMVVAATCDYGWEFKAVERHRRPVLPTWLNPDAIVERHGENEWLRFETWTHGGPPDGGIGATRWGIGKELWEYPEKVLLAKLRSLVRRGLLDGCACGCRGDFTLTEKGRAVLPTPPC